MLETNMQSHTLSQRLHHFPPTPLISSGWFPGCWSWTLAPGYFAIMFFIVLHFTSITSHIHNWVLFSLWLHLFIVSGIISPHFSKSILGIYSGLGGRVIIDFLSSLWAPLGLFICLYWYYLPGFLKAFDFCELLDKVGCSRFWEL